jgi:hypothetical protein
MYSAQLERRAVLWILIDHVSWWPKANVNLFPPRTAKHVAELSGSAPQECASIVERNYRAVRVTGSRAHSGTSHST